MTDDPSTPTQPPAEPPLGIQQPLLPPVPLGQSMLQPKFFTPLGAQSLRILDPSIFLPASDLALPSEESSFQSPFFDTPDVSTPSQSTLSQSTVPTIQTQPQPRPPKSALPRINLSATAPFERIAETPLIETPTLEDHAISEPLIARSSLADLDTPIVEPSINETSIAQTVAVEPPIAEDRAIAEPPIATPLAEPNAAIASALDANETSFNPSESAAIAQSPPSEPLDLVESPSPLISKFSTEISTATPTEPSIEPSISTVSALDSELSSETAPQHPEAPLERSPLSSDNEITPTSTQLTDSAAIQRTTNLADSIDAASLIAPISTENPINSAVSDLTRSDADLPESVQPEFNLTDTILPIASASNPTTASSQPLDNLEEIANVEAAIAQPMLDAPAAISRLTADDSIDPVVDVAESVPTDALPPVVDNSESVEESDSAIAQPMLDASDTAIARLTADESIDPVVDVGESVVQSASDQVPLKNQQDEDLLFSDSILREKSGEDVSLLSIESDFRHSDFRHEDGSNTISQAAVTTPESPGFSLSTSSNLSVEPSSNIARLSEPEADVDINSTSEPREATIQRSPLELTREDAPFAAIATHPVENPISVDENIQPQTNDLVEEKLEHGKLENPIEMSLEQSSVEPAIDSTAINPTPNQTLVQSQIQATSSNTFSILQPQQEHSEENPTSVDVSNSLRRTEEPEIQPEPSLQNSFESAEGTQNLQALDIESLAQPTTLDTPVQRVQPATNTQIDPVTQSNIEPPIQLQTEAPLITSDRAPHEVVDRPKALDAPSIQPVSESQPIQRKVAEVETPLSEVGATVEDESFIEADQTSALPELPSVLQRLSVLEPIATMQSISTAPDTAPTPTVQPTPATRSSVISEIQTQPFESLFEVPFEAPSVRRKSDVGTNDYGVQSAIASSPDSLTPNSITPNSITPNPLTQESPVTAEWGNIAELFNPSADFYSPLEPENALPDDNYPDLLSSTHSTSSEMIQTSPAPPVETAAPVETETNSDREAPAQTPDQTNSSGSPEHLERLAQEVYQLIRQRLALERERGGKSGSGRLL